MDAFTMEASAGISIHNSIKNCMYTASSVHFRLKLATSSSITLKFALCIARSNQVLN